ncbi:MAG: helix-turn-helix domain-containing protein [Jatrophihabitantaceae bacterium]
MVRLHRSGMRQADIAAQFGCDPGNVWHVLKRTGALDGSSTSR